MISIIYDQKRNECFKFSWSSFQGRRKPLGIGRAGSYHYLPPAGLVPIRLSWTRSPRIHAHRPQTSSSGYEAPVYNHRRPQACSTGREAPVYMPKGPRPLLPSPPACMPAGHAIQTGARPFHMVGCWALSYGWARRESLHMTRRKALSYGRAESHFIRPGAKPFHMAKCNAFHKDIYRWAQGPVILCGQARGFSL